MTTFLTTQLRPAIALLIVLTIVTGFLYPLAVTAVAQVAFPTQANGSFIDRRRPDRRLEPHRPGLQRAEVLLEPAVGRGRGTAAMTAMRRPGSNLGPTSQKLIERITTGSTRSRRPTDDTPVPVDLVTTSASGLDPDISPRPPIPGGSGRRGARADRGRRCGRLVARHTEQPFLGFLGQPRVNVLLLNLDLDGLLRDRPASATVRCAADGRRDAGACAPRERRAGAAGCASTSAWRLASARRSACSRRGIGE